MPSVVWSDWAKTFEAAATRLHTQYGPNTPDWRFIAPRSPFWGGAWERLVRSVKTSLRKTIGNRCLKRQELEVTLCEVEDCINSRPITKVSSDPNVGGPLTPNHFLKGHSGNARMDSAEVLNVTASQLSDLYLTRQAALAQFWSRWSTEYISNLPPIVRNRRDGGNLEVNDLVLIHEDNAGPRLKWPLARVVKVHPGSDGKIRAVDLQISNGGRITRPIQKLHRLEVWDSPVSNEFSELPPVFECDTINMDSKDTNSDMDSNEPIDSNNCKDSEPIDSNCDMDFNMDCSEQTFNGQVNPNETVNYDNNGQVNMNETFNNNNIGSENYIVTRYGRRSLPPDRFYCK